MRYRFFFCVCICLCVCVDAQGWFELLNPECPKSLNKCQATEPFCQGSLTIFLSVWNCFQFPINSSLHKYFNLLSYLDLEPQLQILLLMMLLSVEAVSMFFYDFVKLRRRITQQRRWRGDDDDDWKLLLMLLIFLLLLQLAAIAFVVMISDLDLVHGAGSGSLLRSMLILCGVRLIRRGRRADLFRFAHLHRVDDRRCGRVVWVWWADVRWSNL